MKLRAGIHGDGPSALWSAAQLALQDECELAAVAVENEPERTALAAATGAGVAAEDFAALLATGIDLAVLTGPVKDRPEQVRLAAEQGVHCLLHAPMAASAADAERMQVCCEQAAVHLGVLVRPQGDPVFEQLRQMVADGWIGGVVHVQCLAGSDDLLRNPPTTGDPRLCAELAHNPVLQLASHHVHLAAWLTGQRPVAVTGQLSRGFLPLPADSAVATLLLRGNATCTFAASHLLAAEQFAIHGTDGHVRLTGDRIALCGRGEFAGSIFAYDQPGRELVLQRAELREAIDREAPAAELHARFARAIDDRDDFPCPGEQAIEDTRVLDAIGRALHSGATETVR